MKTIPTALALTLIVTLLAVRPVGAEACADLVLTSCTSCHYQSRICEKLGQKSRREWKVTIKRMLRYGLVLDDAGQAGMLECLLALEKDSGKLCR